MEVLPNECRYTTVIDGHEEGVKVLLQEKSINLKLKNMDGETALSIAESYGHEGIVALLRAVG